VGKTALIQALVKHYTKQNLSDPRGPVTVVAGKKRRITLVECPPDLPGALVVVVLGCGWGWGAVVSGGWGAWGDVGHRSGVGMA